MSCMYVINRQCYGITFSSREHYFSQRFCFRAEAQNVENGEASKEMSEIWPYVWCEAVGIKGNRRA